MQRLSPLFERALAVQLRGARRASGLAEDAERRVVPRRALLYVPASNDKMLAKAASLDADCVVLELEDGVAAAAKAAARAAVARWLSARPARLACRELAVRVNSLSSGLLDDDLATVASADTLPDAFMLPKVDSVDDVQAIGAAFRRHFSAERHVNQLRHCRSVAWIESARALLAMEQIVAAALIDADWPPLDALVFGSDDYCADIGATRSATGEETLFARQRVVAVAKAFRLQAIDSVFIDLADEAGLRAQCRQGAAWGFTGKQTIHPRQVAAAHDCFAPPADRVRWATQLCTAFERHQADGVGAFVFEGQMVDQPLLRQARNVLRLLQAIDAP